ncbi:uncharacterized protein [Polyergus mexicanus]|uniref:uncharacterized protein n=1 Tax=Polyergus mexicanus TaxID=615972 RepID=UPI0038B5340C
MHITIDDEEIMLLYFVVCEFYGEETCFCWNENKLVVFPYARGNPVARDVRVLSMPNSLRKIQIFDGRAFFICAPQGAYKLSRAGELVLLSKNALDMGSEFYQVLTATSNGVYLDDKQITSSTLLFSVTSNIGKEVRAFSLILEDTETRFVNCFTAGSKRKGNLCVIAYDKKLFVLKGDNTVQLIYTSDRAIMDIVPVKRQDKIAGLLLLIDMDMVILVHSRDYDLVFEKIHLGKKMRNISAFCACFSMKMENLLWIMYCDQSKMYYMRKELFADTIQEKRVEERTFRCIQYYKSNIILGLSQEQELIEFSFDEVENSLSLNNDVNLHIDMFRRTDFIMEKIYAKVKELNILYESMMDERDNLRRINLYVSKQKLKVTPSIEVSRLCNYNYLELNIPSKLPKNTHMIFAINSKNQSIFCMKKIIETAFTLKMPINENRIQCSSNINMDLITWMNKQQPWCLVQNFIYSPLQDLKRKRGAKKDKTAFIDAKIASLQKLIAEKDLSMTKLNEIKRIIRAEL